MLLQQEIASNEVCLTSACDFVILTKIHSMTWGAAIGLVKKRTGKPSALTLIPMYTGQPHHFSWPLTLMLLETAYLYS